MRRPVPVQFMLKAGRGMPHLLQTKKGPYWRPKGGCAMVVLRWL
jgi:hypothetical protein